MIRFVLFSAVVGTSFNDGIPDVALFSTESSSAHNRVVTHLSPSELSSLDPRIAEFLISRVQRDEELDAYTPQFVPGNMHENAPYFGRLELEHRMFVPMRTVAFSIKDHPKLIVRYVHDCNSPLHRMFPHPILSESFFAAQAAEVGLAPRVYFVSPPARYPSNPSVSPKIAFQLSPIQHLECYLADTTVRFAITERIEGRTMKALLSMGRVHGLANAAKLAIATLPMLQKLHSLNIVHGDLGVDGILLAKDTGGEYRFLFSNFAHTSFTDDSGVSTHRVTSPRNRDYMKTHWEFQGRQYTQRDDLFRLIQIIASVIHPHQYWADQVDMMKDANMAALMSWKEHGNLFEPPSLFNQSARSYSAKLSEIQAIVRECPEKIPTYIYELLEDKFRSILAPVVPITTTSSPTTTASKGRHPTVNPRKRQRYL